MDALALCEDKANNVGMLTTDKVLENKNRSKLLGVMLDICTL